ncbi:unnamed protein product [Symbiodinium sp. CCMP2592]|nr:unnamed protein product [Symbiodinium sp. CCMP2592]
MWVAHLPTPQAAVQMKQKVHQAVKFGQPLKDDRQGREHHPEKAAQQGSQEAQASKHLTGLSQNHSTDCHRRQWEAHPARINGTNTTFNRFTLKQLGVRHSRLGLRRRLFDHNSIAGYRGLAALNLRPSGGTSEKGWSLDEALYEVTSIRSSDLANLLQPRRKETFALPNCKFECGKMPAQPLEPPHSTPTLVPTDAQPDAGLAALEAAAPLALNQDVELTAIMTAWLHWASERDLPKRIFAHLSQSKPDHPIPEEDQLQLIRIACDVMEWDYDSMTQAADGQPFRLNLLQAFLEDPDKDLPAHLRVGVHTGVFDEIQPSGLWPLAKIQPLSSSGLEVCEGNWKPANADPDTVRSLLADEEAEG